MTCNRVRTKKLLEIYKIASVHAHYIIDSNCIDHGYLHLVTVQCKYPNSLGISEYFHHVIKISGKFMVI